MPLKWWLTRGIWTMGHHWSALRDSSFLCDPGRSQNFGVEINEDIYTAHHPFPQMWENLKNFNKFKKKKMKKNYQVFHYIERRKILLYPKLALGSSAVSQHLSKCWNPSSHINADKSLNQAVLPSPCGNNAQLLHWGNAKLISLAFTNCFLPSRGKY